MTTPQPSAPMCFYLVYRSAVGPTVLSNEPPQTPVASSSNHYTHCDGLSYNGWLGPGTQLFNQA